MKNILSQIKSSKESDRIDQEEDRRPGTEDKAEALGSSYSNKEKVRIEKLYLLCYILGLVWILSLKNTETEELKGEWDPDNNVTHLNTEKLLELRGNKCSHTFEMLFVFYGICAVQVSIFSQVIKKHLTSISVFFFVESILHNYFNIWT